MSFPERVNGQKTVYFQVQGQFGNNLFQYFAAQILREIVGYDRVHPTYHINLEFNHVIDDAKWLQLIRAHEQGTPYELDPRKDILLMGFFQRSDVFAPRREKIRQLFQASNMDHISNRVQIGNIVKYVSKHTQAPTENDLTVHLRRGDFWNPSTGQSQIFDPEDLKDLIRDIPHERLFIVRQAPKEDWEREYDAAFESLNPIWIHGNLGDDFDFLMRSTKLIVSASSMAYMAAFLSPYAKEVHIPYNSFYGGQDGTGQHLASFDPAVCHVHDQIRYWIPASAASAASLPTAPSNTA